MCQRWIVTIVLVVVATGEATAETHYFKAPKEGFSAMLILTDKPESFLKEWASPPSTIPNIDTADGIHRGERLVGFIFFANCKEAKGACNASVDFRVKRPDGTLYSELKDVDVWKGRPSPPHGIQQLSYGNIAIRIEPKDPLGVYVIEALVTDHNAHRGVMLSERFLALPAR